MSFNWINPNDYSFNSMLLFERFQIRIMINSNGWWNDKAEWNRNMGIALCANPAVAWYFTKLCPDIAQIVSELIENAPKNVNSEQIREAEVFALQSVEDFTIYTTPEIMAEKCDFMRGWNKEHLFSLIDFSDKTVLDVGAGSGRLTFAAAEKAAWVYASEPVGSLREFMREKAINEGIKNVRVLDGLLPHLPFPDDTFDIVMSGHVVGGDFDAEIAEMTRVCKSEGWLIDCVGDSECDISSNPKMISCGFEEISYTGSFGKLVCNYRKQIKK